VLEFLKDFEAEALDAGSKEIVDDSITRDIKNKNISKLRCLNGG
jgi:hypothetical protein